jgi:hypothetical protein
MVTKMNKEKEKDKNKRKAIEKAEVDKMELLLMGLQVLEPVCEEDIGSMDVHKSHLFMVYKFMADSRHDKFNSCMVMNGNEQDLEMYPDRSSPVVAIHLLLTCLTAAAYNPTYVMAKIDVKVAFVQTEMVGPPVYIMCRKKGLT